VQFSKAVNALEKAGIDSDEFLNQVSNKAVMEAAKQSTPEAARAVLNKPHQTQGTGNNEWYTPPDIIEAAREVLKIINVDPASCEKANEVVQADIFYTEKDDGRTKDIKGNVWMNPPFSQPEVSQFVEKVCKAYEGGDVSQACILTNNCTETVWGQRLLKISSGVCFITGRVKFLDTEGSPRTGALQGQMVCYLGTNTEDFTSSFEKLGVVLKTTKETECHITKN